MDQLKSDIKMFNGIPPYGMVVRGRTLRCYAVLGIHQLFSASVKKKLGQVQGHGAAVGGQGSH